MDQRVNLQELLGEYREVLLEMHACRTERGGSARAWNRLANRLQRVQLELRESKAGRAGITDLAVTDACSTVRSWAASHALFWDEERVRPILEEGTADDSFRSFEGEMVLREFDAGRLNMTWIPKQR